MPQIPFCIVDAFTETPFQGNPAGVFFDDAGLLSDEDAMRLCAEVSLESAFVLPVDPAEADFRLRYFTAAGEVPLCGHATVAALTVLVDSARTAPPATLRIRTEVGILSVDLRTAPDGRLDITLHQNAPQFGEPLAEPDIEDLAGVLGIEAESILATGLPVRVVSTGTPWLLVPVADRDSVDNNRALENAAVITHLSRRDGTFGIYLFAVEWEETGVAVWSRCFAPIAELPEDPVTGSGSGALGAYLAEQGVLTVPDDGAASFTVRQGFAGGRGGTVRGQVARRDGHWRASVTGTALITAAGMFSLPARDSRS
ncbi:MAG: PhzF family phenazine biosynthesis protein [Capsulimonadales bacterium]|nr:PhzF family phenazine biosynthesis protein [Capsulimonadales bacterium]